MKRIIIFSLFTVVFSFLVSCGFHLQGIMPLAEPLKRLYLENPDPYSYLSRNLQQYLKMSNVELVNDPRSATAILVIKRDVNTQSLLGVNKTQQTRQCN